MPQDRSPGDTPRSLQSCLAGSHVLEHGTRLLALDRQLHRQLPPWFEHAQLAEVRAGHAVFLAPSSTLASRLRLEQRHLRDVLRALGEHVDTVAVKVTMPERAVPAPPQLKPLSREAATHLRTAAASMPDPELRARLLALASLAK